MTFSERIKSLSAELINFKDILIESTEKDGGIESVMLLMPRANRSEIDREIILGIGTVVADASNIAKSLEGFVDGGLDEYYEANLEWKANQNETK